MKKIFTNAFALILSTGLFAQSTGTLTFHFTEVTQSTANTYNGNAQHVIAVWIQTGTGTFVKTRLRRVGSGTKDHLGTWAVNAGGTASNATATACNVVGATTGATLSSWTTQNITWDGTNAAGTLVADGAYRVAVQSTWDHGTSTAATQTTYFNFTKGTTADHQTPAANVSLSAITLDWVPTGGVGINETADDAVMSIYPNPSTGIFNVELKNANTVKISNTLGAVVYEQNVEELLNTQIDLSTFANGIYFITVANEKGSSVKKVMLNK